MWDSVLGVDRRPSLENWWCWCGLVQSIGIGRTCNATNPMIIMFRVQVGQMRRLFIKYIAQHTQ